MRGNLLPPTVLPRAAAAAVERALRNSPVVALQPKRLNREIDIKISAHCVTESPGQAVMSARPSGILAAVQELLMRADYTKILAALLGFLSVNAVAESVHGTKGEAIGTKVSPGLHASVYAAGLAEPRGLVFLPSGDLLVAEEKSGSVSKINRDGKVSRIAKNLKRPHDLALGSDGRIYVAEMDADRIAVLSSDGSVSTYIADVRTPVDLDFNGQGELLVCELFAGRVAAFKNQKRARVIASGLSWPHGLAFHSSGAVFINENTGNRIVEARPDGHVRPFALVERPVGLTLAKSGNLYVAQPQVGKVSRVNPEGRVSVLIEGLKEPRDPAFDASGDLYVAETMAGRILRITGDF